MIIIDSAEKWDVEVEKYLHAKGVKTKRERLEFNGEQCGDYTNDKYEFLCERKSWKDFIGSLTDKSLLHQMIKMCENFDGPKYLIFEGDWDAMLETLGKGLKNYALSFPLRLTHVYGIAFIKCYDPTEVADFLILLDRFSKSLTKDESIWKGIHLKKAVDLRIGPLLTVPRLGEQGVKNLLENYHNIANVVRLCRQSPKIVADETPKVGKVIAERIGEIFYSNKPIIDKKKNMSESEKKKADGKRRSYYMKKNMYYESKRKRK